MTELKFTVDESGRLLPRRIDADEAILALTELASRREVVRAKVGAGLKQVFDGLMDRAASARAALEHVSEEAAATQEREVPAGLVGLAPVEVLKDARTLNNFIDGAVRAVELQVSGAAGGFEADERTVAARLVRDRLFPDGRGFLGLSHRKQWLEVQRRFHAPPGAVVEAVEALGLKADFERIDALNRWFGELIGLTAAPAEGEPVVGNGQEQRARGLEAFLGLAVELVAFANVAWPGDGSDERVHRMALLGPYLRPLQRISDERRRSGGST